MALSLTLDYNLRVINEPGFRHYLSARSMIEESGFGDPTELQDLYYDRITGTLFLYPLQIRGEWLNTSASEPEPGDPTNEANSVIRLSQMVIHPDDETDRTIFEEYAFGNNTNHWIFYSPTGFPGTPTFGPPGAGPPVTGAPVGSGATDGLTTIKPEIPFNTYTGSTPVGDITSGKFLAYTKEPLPANQALFFRWAVPDSRIGHMMSFGWYFGQFVLWVTGNLVDLYEDISPGGDRSEFRRIYSKAMFSGREQGGNSLVNYLFGRHMLSDPGAHSRSLLVIPYFRRRLLIFASTGESVSWLIRNDEERLADNSDWKITRSDKLLFWCLSPAPGLFQVQRVRYADGPVTMDWPPFRSDYTPALSPTVTPSEDTDHGTTITTAASTPPSYSFTSNDLKNCPPPVVVTGDQTATHGLSLTFNGESTHRWTPFLYGVEYRIAKDYRDWSTLKTALTIGSTTSPNSLPTNSYVQSCEVTMGDKPGDGRLEAVLLDHPALDLTTYYERSDLPIRLTLDGVAAFTGWTREIQVLPFAEGTEPRELRVKAVDRWRQLSDRRKGIRDNRDWSGTGHIDVVLAMLEEAGVEASFVEHPTKTSSTNTPLGPLRSRLATDTETLQSGWKPRKDDSPADFIARIADNFSGWRYGFRLDGTFYYLPRDHFTATTVTMYPDDASRIAAGAPTAPIYQNPVPFDTEGLKANVVQVVAKDEESGSLLYSSRFIDWASLINPAVANFVGDRRVLIQELPGVFACDELNRMAHQILKRTRLRERRVGFTAPFLPSLKVGQVINLVGYGTFRMVEMSATMVFETWNPAVYVGEALETGY